MNYRIILYLILGLVCMSIHHVSAQTMQGVVYEKANNAKTPLVGANVFWLGTTQGVATDEEGKFKLPLNPQSKRLVVTYIGYLNDTLNINQENYLEISLKPSNTLDIVVVESGKSLDRETITSELLTTKDLRKAACCNLSESFETNPSVDVSTTDAVSGGKQIRMLGLDGVYSQILRENIPTVRGLSARSGLGFIPGTWVKSIDINKGAGSVVNGYESITGQINVELAKPENSEALLLNGYVNGNGRIEGNLNTAIKLSDKWSTGLLLHASNLSNVVDMNEDDFMDTPLYTQLNAINRWKYHGENFEMQFGFRAMYDDKTAGQNEFQKGQERAIALPYGFGAKTQQGEVFGKFGFLSKSNPDQSLGIIVSAAHHNQESFWGVNNYDAQQNTFNLQAIFQTSFGEKHVLKTGASYILDDYDELYLVNNLDNATYDRQRTESVPGVFVEHTFNPSDKLGIVSGLRADFHNLYGTFLSPRLHLKYELAKNSILRLSAGRGLRVVNPIAENIGFLISSRSLDIASDLRPEIAWNYGGNFTQRFTFLKQEATLTLDFYRTDFKNRAVVDLDTDANQLLIYNQDGSAWANSFQANLSYPILKSLDLTVAYKYYDVKTRIQGRLEEAPFVAKHRFFSNLAYATRADRWTFDFTTQWVGSQRLPNAGTETQNMSSRSPSFWLFGGQITHKVSSKWDVYIGGENLANFRQNNAVIGGNTPFEQGFDAGMIYGPVMGRVLYAGFRFTIP